MENENLGSGEQQPNEGSSADESLKIIGDMNLEAAAAAAQPADGQPVEQPVAGDVGEPDHHPAARLFERCFGGHTFSQSDHLVTIDPATGIGEVRDAEGVRHLFDEFVHLGNGRFSFRNMGAEIAQFVSALL